MLLNKTNGEYKMAKLTTPQNALTHVKAYITEIIQDQERAMMWMSPDYKAECEKYVDSNTYNSTYDFVAECIHDAKTFVEVKNILKDMYSKGPNSPERCYTQKLFPLIEKFYNAMKKVVPNLEYKDHGGTECRGWWRVFGEISGSAPYFCSYDLGRDIGMAIDFRNAGAITQQQYNNHVTKRTLKMLGSKRFQTNGQPDANLVLGYLKPEYQTNEYFDMRFINCLELEAA